MQTHTHQMIASHPSHATRAMPALADCIAACFDCAQTCSTCADACLNETHVDRLVRCIRLDLDCADLCVATGRTLSRLSDGGDDASSMALLQACAAICKACAAECERHASMHEHCRICAEACRDCASACDGVMASVRH